MDRRLTCTLEADSPIAVLRVAGTLDLLTSLDVRTALHKVLAAEPAAVAVDLSGLRVAEEISLLLFAAFARAAEAWPGCRTLLYAPDPGMRATLARLAVSRAVAVHTRWEDLVGDARSPALPRRYHRRLPSSPDAPRMAREFVAAVCQEWHLDHLSEDAGLVVTELVSNAVRHAGGDMRLSVAIGVRFLHVAVRDGDRGVPRLAPPDPCAGTGGRGLVLVDAVSAGWGSTPTSDGKAVWATLRMVDR